MATVVIAMRETLDDRWEALRAFISAVEALDAGTCHGIKALCTWLGHGLEQFVPDTLFTSYQLEQLWSLSYQVAQATGGFPSSFCRQGDDVWITVFTNTIQIAFQSSSSLAAVSMCAALEPRAANTALTPLLKAASGAVTQWQLLTCHATPGHLVFPESWTQEALLEDGRLLDLHEIGLVLTRPA